VSENLENDEDASLRERAKKWSPAGITFTSLNIFGQQLTLADIVRLVSPFDRDSALLLLSSLNIHCTLVDLLTKGSCLSSHLPRVKRAIPCVVIFEPLPLRFPTALKFEEALSQKLQCNPFPKSGSRFPVQIFDIEAVENFGGQFGLPSEWRCLLDALEKRAASPELRYKKLSREGTLPDGEHSGSEVLPKLLIASEKSSRERWSLLGGQSGNPPKRY
jgi:hypothetical protein